MDIFDGIKDFFSPVVESGQQLLKFLGILKPIEKTQVDTWKAWGQLLGRLAPAIIGVIAAFKGFKAITGIISVVGQAIMGMFSLIMARPVIAVIALLVAAGIYLYNHWDEITEDMARSFGWLANWIRTKWQQAVVDWWNSWTIDDVFAAVRGYISRAGAYVMRKIDELKAWWDSWTIKDVFAPLVDFAEGVIEDIKKPFIELYDWIADKFSKLNPFNIFRKKSPASISGR